MRGDSRSPIARTSGSIASRRVAKSGFSDATVSPGSKRYISAS